MSVKGALEGIRVLEWAVWLNGPSTGALLGDLGAEVIKIEDPVHGDPTRGMESMYGESMSVPGGSTVLYEVGNRSKLSITLNLKTEKGKEILYNLVSRSDAFLTNFSENLTRKLKTDYETLRRYNQKLVYGLASGLGNRGPDAGLRSFDIILQARSGSMTLAGDRDYDEPFVMGAAFFDQIGASMLATGVVTALFCRERTGRGQRVETSILGAALYAQAVPIAYQTLRGRARLKHTRRGSRNPLSNHYKCADGKWILLCEPQSDRFWEAFCRALGLEDWLRRPELSTSVVRRQHAEELNAGIAAVFMSRARDEWVNLIKEKVPGISFSPILTIAEVLQDPQALEMNYIVEHDHTTLGRIKTYGYPMEFSETPMSIKSRPPEHGEHTELVLQEIGGYSWEEIEQFREEGVI